MVAKIIDTHVHFFDLQHPDLKYVWLEPDFVHPNLGNIDAMKSLRYDVEALWAEARFADIEAFVHVQAALGSADPVDETRWLTEMHEGTPAPFTIVAHADLSSDDAVRQLDGHSESPYFVGIRDFASESYVASGETSAQFESSLNELTKRDLVFDLDCEWQNMGAARALAERHPDLQVVLEHIGFPRRRDEDYFRSWRSAILDLGQAPNVVCKVSGVGMTDPRGVYADFVPWINTCLDAFGADRCVVGSNWPLDRLVSSYDAAMSIYRQAAAQLTASEQSLFFSENARLIYRLGNSAETPG
jgi:predicted TIM-barrel fold metal-dependent hydrolase